jgi:hypothetical protein
MRAPHLGTLQLGYGGPAEFRFRPTVPAILQEAGHVGRPQVDVAGGSYEA